MLEIRRWQIVKQMVCSLHISISYHFATAKLFITTETLLSTWFRESFGDVTDLFSFLCLFVYYLLFIISDCVIQLSLY